MANIGFGDPVITPDAGGVYTLTASGLVAGQTSIFLETTSLAIGRGCAPGVATIDFPTSAIAFMLPAPMPWAPNTYLRIRVVVTSGSDKIEAPPGWWVHIP